MHKINKILLTGILAGFSLSIFGTEALADTNSSSANSNSAQTTSNSNHSNASDYTIKSARNYNSRIINMVVNGGFGMNHILKVPRLWTVLVAFRVN